MARYIVTPVEEALQCLQRRQFRGGCELSTMHRGPHQSKGVFWRRNRRSQRYVDEMHRHIAELRSRCQGTGGQ